MSYNPIYMDRALDILDGWNPRQAIAQLLEELDEAKAATNKAYKQGRDDERAYHYEDLKWDMSHG